MVEPKQIAVTGAAGFIGSYLTRRLLLPEAKDKLNFKIIGVDEPPFFAERSCSRELLKKLETILSPQDFLRHFNSLNLEVVFHLGACSNTEEKRADYIRAVNLDYSKALWDLCTEKKIPFYYASSAGTYGKGDKGFSDDPALIKNFEPLSLYAQSKHDFDKWVLQQKKTPPNWGGFKFFNVYGPGEDHKGRQASMAYHLAEQLRTRPTLKLYKSYKKDFKDGEQARDFVYVDDVASVLIEFYKKNLKAGIYNVGTGKARTFIDLAQAVGTALGKKIEIEFIDMPEALKAQYQYWTCADLTRLHKAGYTKSFLSLEDGVKKYFLNEGKSS